MEMTSSGAVQIEKDIPVDLPDPKEVKNSIEQLKNLGISVSSIKKYLRDYSKAWEERGPLSQTAYTKLKGHLEKGWSAWSLKRLEMDLVLCDLTLKALKDLGIPLERYRERLKSVDRTDVSNASSALHTVLGIRKDLASTLEPHKDVILPEAWSALDRAMDSYEEIAGMEEKAHKVKKTFKKVVQATVKKDVNNILIYSKTLHTEVQRLLSDEMAKDRYKAIKDEVKGLLGMMDEYRKFGLEPDGLREELSRIDGNLETGKVTEAQSQMNRITKNLSRAEKELQRRKGTVNMIESMELLEEYGTLLDLSGERAVFNKLIDEQGSIPPKRFMEESGALLGRIKDDLFKNFQGQVKERMEVLERSLVGIGFASEESRSQLEDLKGSIEDSLKNHNITEAMEYLSLAESTFGQSEGELRLIEVKNNYSRFLADYENLLNEDADITELREQLSSLEQMFLSEEIGQEELSGRVYEAGVMVQDRIVDLRKKMFGRERERFLSMMDSISLSGSNRTQMESKLDELGSLIGNVEEEVFREAFSGFRSDLEGQISGYVKDNFSPWSERLGERLRYLSSVDMDTSPLLPLVDEANHLYSEGKYLEVGDLMRTLEGDIDQMNEDIEVRKTEELINSAEFMFEEARRAGVEVEGQTPILHQAKELMSRGDHEGANRLAQQVEGFVKSHWMEMKRHRLESDMNGLRTYAEESGKIGLDITDAVSMLHEAEYMFDDQQLDKVSELVGRARESIDQKRSSFYSSSALDTITHLKEELASLNQMGINTLEAETMLIEAERLFMNEEYEKAYSLTLDIRENIAESRDGYLKDLIPRELNDVKEKVKRLEGLGLDTSDIRGIIEEAESEKDLGTLLDSVRSIKKAREVSDELFKSHITLAIPETIVDVKKQLEIAIEEGMDLQEVDRLLRVAEDLFRTEEYDQAMEAIEKAQDTFKGAKKEFFKGKYEKNMEAIESIMGKAEGMDMEMDLTKANINMAKDAFERGDFEASHMLVDKVMKFLERSMDDRSTSKRRETVQTYYDEVRTLLMVAEGENIDVSEERALFKIASELLAKGDFDQTEHVLEGIKLGINDKRLQMKRKIIERSIQTTDILLQNMNEMGIDTTFERSLIEQLKEALRRNDLDLCDEINMKLMNALQNNQGPYIVQKVQRELAELRAKIMDTHAQGLDTKAPQQFLNDAIALFEKNELEGSEVKIAFGEESLKEIIEARDKEEYERMLVSLKAIMVRLTDLGIPVDDEEALIASSRECLDKNEIQTALSWLQTATIGAQAKLNSYHKTTSEGYLVEIPAYLDQLRIQGMALSDLERFFNEGVAEHEAGEYEKAVSKFSSILQLGEEQRNLRDISLLRKVFRKHQEKYSDLKEVGMKASKKLDEAFESANAILMKDSVDTTKVTEVLARLDGFLAKRSEPFIKALAKKHIGEVRVIIKEMGDKAGDPTIVSKLKEAARLFAEEDLAKADTIALELKDELESLRMQETEQVLKREISSVKQMLLRLKTLGSNVTNAERLVSRSESAIEAGRIENAERMIGAVREAVTEIVNRNMRETAMETIEFTEAMVKYLTENFSGVTSHIAPANEKIKEAKDLFKDKAFKDAKLKAEEARALIESSELQNLNQFLYVFRNMQADEISNTVKTRIAELSQRGMDVTKLNLLYEKANEHFGKEEYEKGRQMITFARVMISEMDQQSLRDSAVEELNTAHLELLKMKKEGLDVTNAYKLYNNAKEAFSAGEFKKSILLAKKSVLRPKA